jgi:hypothetical protein
MKNEISDAEIIGKDITLKDNNLPCVMPANGKYHKSIARVHSAFFNASNDLLMNEKNLLIAEQELLDIKNKAKDLKKLGFGKSSEVTIIENILDNDLSKKCLATVYSQKYYPYKFITQDAIGIVCKKYNLTFGGASEFTGFIPPYNLEDIKRFKETVCRVIEENNDGGGMNLVHVSDLKFSSGSTSKEDKIAREYVKNKNGRFLIHDPYGSVSKSDMQDHIKK